MNFNPFNKSLKEVKASDLAILKTTSEGWYVEYKQSLPIASKIAKSICAFANHYGGWLFFGIESSDDGQNVAKSFPGVTANTWNKMQQRIRDAVAQHINPIPHFECVAIKGPCKTLSLSKTNCVITIQIPQGNNPPYIHSSGRIYRRVADKSDPVHETDRNVLDLLWERKQTTRDRFKRFIEEQPILSSAEDELTLFSAYFFADPLREKGLYTDITLDDFIEILKKPDKEFGGIPFDNFFSAVDSYIARQVLTNDPYTQLLTWRHYFSGTSVCHMPLRCGLLSDPNTNYRRCYKYFNDFVDICREQGVEGSRWLDLNLLVPTVQALVAKQELLMEKAKIRIPIFMKVKLSNVWRRIPFIDTELYIKQIRDHKVPIIQDNSFFVPYGVTPESLVELKEPKGIDDNMRLLGKTAAIWSLLASSVGLESAIISSAGSEGVWQLLQAAERGAEAHRAQP